MHCVHSLCHIPKDVQKFGDLNQYGAFPFESYMSQIKRKIKKHNTPQAELCNRIEEQKKANFVKGKLYPKRLSRVNKNLIKSQFPKNAHFHCSKNQKSLIKKEFFTKLNLKISH